MEHIFPRMLVEGDVRRLVGCDPGELAIATNVSLALSTIASCLDFSGERRRVMLSELDFPTDGHVWLAQERRGAEVVWLASPDGLTVPLEAYAEAIDERTAVVLHQPRAVPLDRWWTRRRSPGWPARPAPVGRRRLPRRGIIPVDVHDLGCDFYTTGVLKWLCGGPG